MDKTDKWWTKLSLAERYQVVAIYRDGTPFQNYELVDFQSNREARKALYNEAKRYWDMYYPNEEM